MFAFSFCIRAAKTLSASFNRPSVSSVHLKKALEKNPFDPDVLIDLGRIYFLDGQYPKALTTLKSTMGDEHNNPIGDFFYGRTLLTLGRLKDAERVFAALIQKENANNVIEIRNPRERYLFHAVLPFWSSRR